MSGAIPVSYGVQVGFSFQSLPGYCFGTSLGRRAHRRIRSERRADRSAAGDSQRRQHCVADHAVNDVHVVPRQFGCARLCRSARRSIRDDASSLSVPLIAPMTEFGDRINQLDLNVTKTIKVGHVSIQPKFDLFNVLNVSPVTAVLGLNYGTASYKQPSVVLNPRTYQVGAIIRF